MSHIIPEFEHLPSHLPVLAYEEAVLLPGGALPLRIAEPDNLRMVEDVLSRDRLIGIARIHSDAGNKTIIPAGTIGCAGRLHKFEEHVDTFIVTLMGTYRFRVSKPVVITEGSYPIADINWHDFAADCQHNQLTNKSRNFLLKYFRLFITNYQLSFNRRKISSMPDSMLINMILLFCPLGDDHYRRLLSVDSQEQRAQILTELLINYHQDHQNANHPHQLH